MTAPIQRYTPGRHPFPPGPLTPPPADGIVAGRMLDRFYHYTFLDGRLVGTEHPDLPGRPVQIAERLVRELGVRTRITLTPLCRQFGIPGLAEHHVPMGDRPTRADVARAVELVRTSLAGGGAVWVHCQHGIDRTGCVIGSYLAAAGRPPEAVVAELFGRFPERRRHPRMVELWRPYADMIRSFA